MKIEKKDKNKKVNGKGNIGRGGKRKIIGVKKRKKIKERQVVGDYSEKKKKVQEKGDKKEKVNGKGNKRKRR